MFSRKFDPFDYQNLFYEYDINIDKNEINQILLLLKNNNLDSKEQITTFNYLNVLNFPILKNLKDQIINILDKHKLLLDNNWAQLYNMKNEHSIHTHSGSFYSGIIYIMGKKASPTIFYDRKYKNYCYKFKNNKLLMFPSDIPQEVKKLNNDEDRLIISFNTRQKLCTNH